MSFKVVILAAGKGKRLNLSHSKMLLEIMGRSLIENILDKVTRIHGLDEIITVVGFDKKRVIEKAEKYNSTIIEQKNQLGTADALWSISSYLKNYKGYTLILNGDLPLLSISDLENLTKFSKKYVNIATAILDRPDGFGRIIRSNKGKIINIAEETELTQFEKSIKEVNVGVYFLKWDVVKSLFNKFKKHKNGEYYITDIVEIAHKNDIDIGEFAFESSSAVNLNTWGDFARVCDVERVNIIKTYLSNGIKIPFINSVYIEHNVEIGQGTTINPFTVIEKNIKIGKNCTIGPFARLRSGTRLEDEVIIGNFMEVKNTNIGYKSKARHLSYLGDAIIGKNVNIGAGTITANYDGKRHNVTIIEDGVTTGSGTVLIAPVKMGKNSQTGAGAIVTKNNNVPDNEIVIGIPAKPLCKKSNSSVTKKQSANE